MLCRATRVIARLRWQKLPETVAIRLIPVRFSGDAV
jgi:hypothetical protein